MSRKPKDGKMKSGQELETAYIEKVEHSMERIGMWSQKLVKLSASRRGYLTDEDKAKILVDYDKLTTGILEDLRSKDATGSLGYKLR
jgi:hypothetical protein